MPDKDNFNAVVGDNEEKSDVIDADKDMPEEIAELEKKYYEGTITNEEMDILIKYYLDGDEEFIVRRLMPVECARLQGMPDWWCSDLSNDNPSQEEIDKWREVFYTFGCITGDKDPKKKSDNQIKKWLSQPYSDSAEYKMWGNGIALPCALYVFEGIVKEYENEQ